MTIEAYLAQLRQQLAQLTEDERADVLDFYTEYIEDAQLTADDVLVRLGTPRQLARKILADYSIKQNESTLETGQRATAKSNVSLVWVIILAILSTPVTIPISILLLVIIFTILLSAAVVIGGILITILGAIVGLAAIGGVALYFGVGLILTNFFIGTAYLGMGLAGIGLALVLIPFLVLMTKVLCQAFANFFRFLYRKFAARRHRQEVA